jgi:hypothetical protein
MHLERALDLWPSRQGLAHVYLAMLKGFAGDVQGLEEHRALALAEAAGDVEVLLRVAYLDLLTKQPMRALEVVLPLADTSDHPGVNVVLGWAEGQIAARLHFAGDKAKAEELVQRARARVEFVMPGGPRRAPRRWERVGRQVFTKAALAPPPGEGR